MSLQQGVVYDVMTEKRGVTPFGLKLKELRRKIGLSQFQVAIKLGKTPSKVAQYESGVRNPTKVSIQELVDVLGFTPAERDELLIAAGFVPEGGMPEQPSALVPAVEAALPPVSDISEQEKTELMGMVKGYYSARNEGTRQAIAEAVKRILEEEEREKGEDA